MSEASAMQALIEGTLRFTWFGGAVTQVGSHTTGWRTSPGCCLVHLQRMRTQIEMVDQPLEVAEDGTAIALDAQSYHRLTSTAEGFGLCRWGHCNFHVLGGISVMSLFSLSRILRPPYSVQLGDMCEALAQLHLRPPPAPITQAVRRTAIGMQLLAAILGQAPVNERGISLLTHADRLQPVLRWIDERLSEEACRESLARIAGLSPSRFHALFQLIMRQSPMAYLAGRRVQRAQLLLMTSTRQVQEVAQAVGYADPFHFSRVFKQLTGESPQVYRLHSRQWLQAPEGPAGITA